MALSVPLFPPDFRYASAGTSTKNTIRAGTPVRSSQWTDMAKAVNWLHGRGGTLVSSGPYIAAGGGLAAGSSAGFNYYVWPRYECTERLWTVQIIAGASGSSAFGTITSGSFSADWAVDGAAYLTSVTTVYLQETVTASATPAGVTLTVANDSASAGAVYILGVTLHELPRNTLPAGYGVDVPSVDGGQFIYGGAAADLSIDAVHAHSQTAKTIARKSHLFSWWNPVGVTEAGTTPVELWGFSPYVSCRLLESANTTRSVAWAAYGAISGTGSGHVVLDAGTGDSDAITFTSTTPAWQASTLTINTEDPSRWLTDGGQRSGTGDNFMASIANITATDVTVLGICMAESS